jgi:hypothetical protein
MKPAVATVTQRRDIEGYAEEIKSLLNQAWPGQIYREQILKGRNRSYHFGELSRGASVVVQHTLLGVELKVGRRRFLCPDLATARYLSVFARAGCSDVAIPYDITQLSRIADDLESAWQRMLLLIEHHVPGYLSTRIRGLLIAKLREEVAEAGAGTPIPAFKQSTKQRLGN